jgi:hypothetical protein
MRLSAVLNLVSYKDHSLVAKNSSNTVVEDMTSDSDINSAQWVIKEVDITVSIDASSKSHTCLLPTTQRNSFFAHASLIPFLHSVNVVSQATGIDSFIVTCLIEREPKGNVFPNSTTHNPRLLLKVSHASGAFKSSVENVHLTQNGQQ